MNLKKLGNGLTRIRALAAPLQSKYTEATQIIISCDRIQDAIRDYNKSKIREWRLKDSVKNNLAAALMWALKLKKELSSNPKPAEKIEKRIVELGLQI